MTEQMSELRDSARSSGIPFISRQSRCWNRASKESTMTGGVQGGKYTGYNDAWLSPTVREYLQ